MSPTPPLAVVFRPFSKLRHLAVLGAAFTALTGFAATYYIDPLGNNANSGLSTTQAWSDFTNVNSRTLVPGDKVLLKRGGLWNQQLTINGKGTAASFIEVDAYGTGGRPRIERTGYIGDRCVVLNNPAYVKVSRLHLAQAGSGILVNWQSDSSSYLGSVYIDSILARYILGVYHGSGSQSGVPAWQSYTETTGFSTSGGVNFMWRNTTYTAMVPAVDLKVTNSEFYFSTSGVVSTASNAGSPPPTFKSYQNVLIDRIYVHEMNRPTPSPDGVHLVSISGLTLRNSIFDGAANTAPFGTAALFLANLKTVSLQNTIVRNTPQTASPDNVGIDLEWGVDDAVIDNVTFDNNAGSGMMHFKGAASRPNTNIQVQNSRFIGNDYANKHGLRQVWSETADQTATYTNNKYYNAPGTAFIGSGANYVGFTNTGSVGYSSRAALESASTYNRAPTVSAGADLTLAWPTNSLVVTATATNDGAAPTITWEQIAGPPGVTFSNAASLSPTVTFPGTGTYSLLVRADDGVLWVTDRVNVTVSGTAALFGDDFQDGNDTTPLWGKVGSGTWVVQADGATNKVYAQTSSNSGIAFAGSNWTDYTVSLDVRPRALASGSTTMSAGLLARYVSDTQLYSLRIVAPSNRAQIVKFSGLGVSTTLAETTNGSYALNTWYTLRLIANGSSLTGYVYSATGTLLTTVGPVTDTSYASGKIGVRTAGGQADFDDVLAEP